MLPKINSDARIRTGNEARLYSKPVLYHPVTGVPLAGTQIEQPSKQYNSADPNINPTTGVVLAGTTVPIVGVITQSNDVRNSLPEIRPKFGSRFNQSSSWLVILAIIGTVASVYAARKASQ
jgi:hypothetical protein